MDWIGIIIFIIFIILKSRSESEKQKKQREARQKKGLPTHKRTIPEPLEKTQPPVVVPEWELPPFFPFFVEEEEVKKPAKIKPAKQEAITPEKPTPSSVETQPAIDAKVFRKESPKKSLPVAELNLEQAQLGVIWSEILGPPRSLRPYQSRGYRGLS